VYVEYMKINMLTVAMKKEYMFLKIENYPGVVKICLSIILRCSIIAKLAKVTENRQIEPFRFA